MTTLTTNPMTPDDARANIAYIEMQLTEVADQQVELEAKIGTNSAAIAQGGLPAEQELVVGALLARERGLRMALKGARTALATAERQQAIAHELELEHVVKDIGAEKCQDDIEIIAKAVEALGPAMTRLSINFREMASKVRRRGAEGALTRDGYVASSVFSELLNPSHLQVVVENGLAYEWTHWRCENRMTAHNDPRASLGASLQSLLQAFDEIHLQKFDDAEVDEMRKVWKAERLKAQGGAAMAILTSGA